MYLAIKILLLKCLVRITAANIVTVVIMVKINTLNFPMAKLFAMKANNQFSFQINRLTIH